MKHITTFILFYVLLTFCCKAQTPGGARTDNHLKENMDVLVKSSMEVFMNDTSRVGVSVGVYINDKTFIYNYGTTQKGKNIKPTNSTIYEIGSVTKTFTGILLAQAIVDKKVKINDDIRKYLEGDYPNLSYKGH